MQSSPSQPEKRGSLKRVKFNSNMPQCTVGWRLVLVPGRWSAEESAVEFELELATCNWQRSEVRSSAHKKSIKSEASASSPLCQFASCYCSCAQFGLCPSVPLSLRPSVRESIYAPLSQLELECMRVLASAFSRINSESCAKRTRQDTKETDAETVRKRERDRERKEGYGTDRLRFACPGPFERVELSNDFARGWQLMPLHYYTTRYPLPVTRLPVTHPTRLPS